MAGSAMLDALARPRARAVPWPRSLAGAWLLGLIALLPLGVFLTISGNLAVSTGLALALVGLFTMISNAKRAMLGEALVFSDLALLGAVFRHPQFYFSALSATQKALLACAAPIVPALLWWVFVPDAIAHLTGIALLVGAAALLAPTMTMPPWTRLAAVPDSEADVQRHGLIPTVALHWWRWRKTKDPVPLPAIAGRPPQPDELAIIIQCESFADPAQLFGDAAIMLPGLVAARDMAWASGTLCVHGFGAYTMRTEYGVVFGRSQEALGFRRFDPFLTALGEASYALPQRIAPSGWRSLFVHPHDMRFYNRQAIMTAAGFAELVGEERFAPPRPEEGRYVTDAAMAAEILSLAQAATGPTMIYAVTIENHGPWTSGPHDADLRAGYLRLLGKGDAMLATLAEGLAQLKRPATLVFFGDHRPSIPGHTSPDGARDTPYVMLRLDRNGQPIRREGASRDAAVTPAGLHQLILDVLLGND
ncbi:MAG: LTA synthase family protein [Novosphingobium sp.]|nr:LTA synthase family protein [Novosphingobium sp.]